MTIGQNIRACRKQRGLTQNQLGALCGMRGSAISAYENGAVTPKRRVVERLAQALDVSPDRLLEAGAPLPPPAGPNAPLYDGVLAALKELYGAVEGRVVLGENGASRRYYVVQGVSDSFVLHETDVAAIARAARASMAPMVEYMRGRAGDGP